MNQKLRKLLNPPLDEWNDWNWQMKHQSTSSDISLLASLGLVSPNVKKDERVGLTPYNLNFLLNLKETDKKAYHAELLQSFLHIDKQKDIHQWSWALRRDLPSGKLSKFLPKFLGTLFFGRGADTETKALENMYPKTDVIIVTAHCARKCSFCFREVGNWRGEASRFTGDMKTVLMAVDEVIKRKTPHVLLTGGDPLTRSNVQLQQIFTPLVESESVEVLRLATRMVVDLPMRFYDKELLAMLREYAVQMKDRGASFRIVTQVNHVCELTSEAIIAIKNIQACGVNILNQTVVLKGVNDTVEDLRNLFMTLDCLNIRNHKLFCTMPVADTEHMRVSVREFRELLAGLHQWIPGTSVPQGNINTLVGKIPISPRGRYMIPIPFTNRLLVKSFKGEWFLFRDVWDKVQLMRQGLVFVFICLCFVLGSLLVRQSNQIQVVENDHIPVNKIIHMTEVFDYPDYWARSFESFVSNGILYTP